MADRPGDDQSQSCKGERGGWPTPRCGVAPGFRNFCITNEHPDGIVFEPRNETEGQRIANDLISSSNVTSGADEATGQDEVSESPRSRRSSSSSIVSCSPCNSEVDSSLPSSPCSSAKAFSDVGTISISSSSSDDDVVFLEDSPQKKTNKKQKKPVKAGKPEKDKFDNKNTGFNTIKGNEDKTSKVKTTSPIPSTSKSSNLPSASGLKGDPLPPVGTDAVETKNSDTDTAPIVLHKKFHYKARTANKTKNSNNFQAETSKSSSAATTGGQKRELETSKDDIKLCTEKIQRPASVDDLNLSPYITREQAESRLRALGSLEATQKEIDNFSGLIYSSAMFRLQLNGSLPISNSSAVTTVAHVGHALVCSVDSSKNAGQQTERGQLAASSSSSMSLHEATPASLLTGPPLFASSTTSDSFASGGDVFGKPPTTSCSCSVGKRDSDNKDNHRKQTVVVETRNSIGGSGGYFMVTAPGQACTNDDHEWISD